MPSPRSLQPAQWLWPVTLTLPILAAPAAFAEDAEQDRERRESLRLAVAALARRAQTYAHRIQETVSLLADRHPAGPDVLEAGMQADHAAAQQGRHARSLAVLCGDWPGRQWPSPLALVDVVRAAAARIVAYKRVEVSGDPDTAAAAKVVEPLIHLVAELPAHATQSSPPATTVLVAVRNVQRGAVIEIDDGGVGMDEHRLEQAREVVSGRLPVGVGEMGEIPQAGLAVVGHYVRRHGFLADLLPSPYGGVRAVVPVPSELVEPLEPVPAPPPSTARVAVPRAKPHAPSAATELPRRTSKRPGGTAGRPATAPGEDPDEASPAAGRDGGDAGTGPETPGGPATGEPAPDGPTPEQAGAWMAAFFDHDADTEPGDDD
ncbi:ATP-binding protein [Nonomuraea typhae]|uniref:ATP-binding protein n=1 Tax=Nonomuraea typhae TaxID=2603600 RepID=UPI0012FBD3D1|nr:ATP-binding protein [Nonomuraea typhae]